jgi:hypothetical protein
MSRRPGLSGAWLWRLSLTLPSFHPYSRQWRYRLGVRTDGSQPSNQGSNPCSATNQPQPKEQIKRTHKSTRVSSSPLGASRGQVTIASLVESDSTGGVQAVPFTRIVYGATGLPVGPPVRSTRRPLRPEALRPLNGIACCPVVHDSAWRLSATPFNPRTVYRCCLSLILSKCTSWMRFGANTTSRFKRRAVCSAFLLGSLRIAIRAHSARLAQTGRATLPPHPYGAESLCHLRTRFPVPDDLAARRPLSPTGCRGGPDESPRVHDGSGGAVEGGRRAVWYSAASVQLTLNVESGCWQC